MFFRNKIILNHNCQALVINNNSSNNEYLIFILQNFGAE